MEAKEIRLCYSNAQALTWKAHHALASGDWQAARAYTAKAARYLERLSQLGETAVSAACKGHLFW